MKNWTPNPNEHHHMPWTQGQPMHRRTRSAGRFGVMTLVLLLLALAPGAFLFPLAEEEQAAAQANNATDNLAPPLALMFDGNDDWVQAPSFDLADDFAFSFWAEPAMTDDNQAFLSKQAADGSQQVLIGFYNGGYAVGLRAAPTDTEQFYAAGDKQTGWQHLAVVGEHTDDATQISFYRNGALLWQETFPVVMGDISAGPGWSIGQRSDGSAGIDSFAGKLAQVSAWNILRTAEQIEEEYALGIRGDEPDLAAYWPFSEVSGSTAFDTTANSRHATLGPDDPFHQPRRWARELHPFQGNSNLITSSELFLGWTQAQQTATDSSSAAHYAVLDFDQDADTEADRLIPQGAGPIPDALPAGGNQHIATITGDFTNDGLDEVLTAWDGGGNVIHLAAPAAISETLSWTMTIPLSLTNTTWAAPGDLNQRQIRLQAGDLTGDGRDNVVLAYRDGDGNARLEVFDVLPDADGNLLQIEQLATVSDQPVFGTGGGLFPQSTFDIAVGDFDDDREDDIALVAFSTETDQIGITTSVIVVRLYERDSSVVDAFALTTSAETSIDISNANYIEERAIRAVAGDFSADGGDDLAVSFYQFDPSRTSDPGGALSVAFFGFNSPTDPNALSLIGRDDLRPVGSTRAVPFTSAAGDMTADWRDELVVIIEDRTYAYQLELDTVRVLPIFNVEIDYGSSTDTHLYSHDFLAIADLNADQADELIIATNTYEPYDAGETLYRQEITVRVYENTEADIFEPRPEPDQVENYAIALSLLAERTFETIEDSSGGTTYPRRHFALAAGDFDGGGVRVGFPSYYRERKVGQILAIINAPPTHRDVLDDGTEITVATCEDPLSPGSCTYVLYERETTEQEVNVNVSSSWTLDERARETSNGSFPNIPTNEQEIRQFGDDPTVLLSRVTENLTRSYGQNFEKTESRTVELTVNEQVWAFADDALVYTVADYDVWEYPVLSGSELVSDTHIMATFPRPHCTPLGCEDIQVTKQQGNLLDSPYLPYHEVLNILSYPPDRSGLRNLLPADATDQQSVFDIPAFSLGGGLVNQITLERSIIENWEDVRSRSQSVLSVNEEKLGGQTGSVDVGFAIEFNGSPLGVGASSSASVGLSGDFELPYFINEFQNEYGSENISTHSMTLQEDLTIQFQFTHLIEEVQEEYPYTISPFVYWSARTNAFVIDFAADPIVEPGNGWDTYYNKPDPSFNLPWRLDSNLVLQQRTKELGVLTATAGLEANLQAKVHNYGLQDTPQPIDVAFYLPSDYVYTLDGQQTIQAAFASDPLNPESVGTFEVPQADAIHQAVVVNDHAHIAAENGLWVFNVARPDVPTQSGFSGLDGTVPALGVDVAGDIAYVAAGEQGIVVVDVSNPAQPQVVGTYTYTDPTPGYVAGAAQRVVATTCRIGTAQQPCVFVAEAPATVDDQQQGGGLRILNVQDPANPVQIGYLNLGQAVNDLTVPGADYAYLAAADGLHVIDIRSANSPQMTGFYATDSAVQDVAVEEDYAYLALGEAGLQTILMSNDRQTLRDESTYTLLYSAEAVAASGGVLYLADAGRGLVILEALNDPAQPREVGYLAGRSTSLALALDSTAQHVGTPQEIGRVQLPPIPSREFRVASVPWTPPTNGSYRIYSVIDPENLLVDEVKESNNTAYNIIDVCPNGRAPELCQEEQQRTLPVVLAPTDLPPIAMDDSITGTITSTLSIDVISNDRDFYGNPLTVSIEEEPTYGTASVVGTAITYTPGDEFPGFDSFTYTVSNGQQTSRPARVTVGSAPAVTTDYTLYLPLIQR